VGKTPNPDTPLHGAEAYRSLSRRVARLVLLSAALCLLNLPAGLAQPDDEVAASAARVLERRCMVCHGCYDAPCQLKLEAHAGLLRGASKDLVYNGTRLVPAQLTRLFDDGFTQAQWRERGFYPVIDPQNPQAGVMRRMLELKRAHPLPTRGPLPSSFDFSLYRDQQCPKQEEFDDFARDYTLWGMPYGLPGIEEQEHDSLVRWLDRGAPAPPLQPLSSQAQRVLTEWETFLNGSSARERLMSRYLYEHLFLAAIHLGEPGQPAWFRMVRSYTPPGRDIGLIATRRPYDDPGTSEFYYRLQRMPVAPLSKRHMPYRFDRARMQRYRTLFLEQDYEVESLPGYEPTVASNPFKTFRAIPVKSRYRFMLDEAQFTIMNFIKGPVCRGQVALNVIDDHFWVMFVDPERFDPEHDEAFLAAESDNLRLPSARTATPVDLLAWRRYANGVRRYQQAKSDYLAEQTARSARALEVESIWDGDGYNDNAALTVFRHFDSASVVKGFVGQSPKTAWVVGYPLLERIHYLLVAGFDVYGSMSHQLESRLYMDFLRMEGEFNFLIFLPEKERERLLDHWYREAPQSARRQFTDIAAIAQINSSVQYLSADPKREFLAMQQRRLHGADAVPWSYRGAAREQVTQALAQLESRIGEHNRFMPQVSLLNVIGKRHDEVYTVLRNSAYSNIAQLFREDERRLPREDSLTVVRGLLGAYPNRFFLVNESEMQAFVDGVAKLESESDYAALVQRFGVRRNDPWFWRLSDKLHEMMRRQDPLSAGLLDFNRYEGDTGPAP
jgi:hypothetical protein